MENLDKRSESRQMLQQPVSLHAPDAEQPVVGKTRNLSPSGMCVFMTPTPPVGQELMCELPNGQAVRGRVAWVMEPDADDLQAWSGVGIEFVDHSKVKVNEIAAQISVDPLIALPGPVDVWFDGLDASTRAVATRRDGAVELSSTLSFLREGTDVRILPASMKGQTPLQGRVANVFLRSDGGTPRLVISLALEHEVLQPPGPGDERWFPEISIDEPRSDDPTASLEAAAPSMVEPEATEKNEQPEVSDDDDPEAARSTLRKLVLGGVVVAAAGLLALRLGFPAQEQVEPLPVVAAVSTAAVPVEPAPVPEVAPPVAQPEPVAAETPHAEFASAELSRKPAKAEPVADVAPAVAPATVVAPVAHIAAAPAMTDVPGPAWLPHVTTIADKAQVIVPLGGSTKGINRFLLDSPPGIAVDLPDATTLVPVRSYLLHDAAFYSLWVRKAPSGKGLQIRLHTTKGVHVGADIVDGNLRFRRKD